MPPTEPARPENCSRCGAVFSCGVLAGSDHCWCYDLPPIEVSEALTRCLCPTCLQQDIEQRAASSA